ncbi:MULTISPECIES: alpha/beta fold hydrolase [unclassified Moorena]|uniref:alpha/beta fold hydrolase n=1 Tax=unclassified Moorena TaxID=2683338 RepID=UPI0013FEAE52|nr:MULTISPECIES: alpha/beta fold hydrolase [unclassified Moorena]NEO12703.1 alpha/beta fold hydrolase [Moorena sp. SIO3E8]NEQ04042.1 alpha/beta fold hydrolase [Moorena sp. SIO3F7]
MTTATNPTQINSGIGGTKNFYNWNWQNKHYRVVYETIGAGNPVLLLPAFSTVSSRTEMKGIANLLATNYHVTVLDWLGFGESQCPPVDYNPVLFQQLLADFVNSVFNNNSISLQLFSDELTSLPRATSPLNPPILGDFNSISPQSWGARGAKLAVIAAGHASGYALKFAQDNPDSISKLILVAPTWKGPLRVMGLPDGVRNGVKNLVRSPWLGQTLYYLNTTPSFLRLMYKRHVYVDESKLTPEFIAQKHKITSKDGGRYAPAAFVTGAIDPIANREEFLQLLDSVPMPVLIILAENAPPKSKAEMIAMAELEQVQTVRLAGTLGISEEYHEAVTAVIEDFI